MLTLSQLDALGISPEQLGDRSPVPRLDVAVGKGSGAAAASVEVPSVGELVEREYLGATFVDVDVPAARRHGVRVQRMKEDPRILRLLFEDGELDRVLTESRNGHGELYAVDTTDPNLIVVDTRPSQALFLLRTTGDGVTVEPLGGQDAEIGEVLGPLLEIPPLQPVESPVAAWVGACGDSWLQARIAERLALDTPWQCAVALGLYARLLEPQGNHRAALAALLEGREDRYSQELDRPLKWIRQAEPAVVETVDDLAIAEADRLLQDLEDLQRYPPRFADGPTDVLRVCHWRDDLEGVRVLLSAADRANDLDAVLALVDEAGAAVMNRFRPVPPVADERLERVAGANPLLWWTLPVQEPEEAWEAEFGERRA